MNIIARQHRLILLIALLLLCGFTVYARWGRWTTAGMRSGRLNSPQPAATQFAASGNGRAIIARPRAVITGASLAALTNDFFVREEVTIPEPFEPLQSGGPYNISPSIVAGGGGGGPSAGGSNTVTGSVGQSALGVSGGGSFSVSGGFWQGAAGGGCPTIIITPMTLPNGQLAVPYSQQLSQSGGIAPVTWSISLGALPGGLDLNPATGLLSGTPTASGPFNFTVKVTDTNGCMGTQAYTLAISSCPTITITPASLPAGASFTFYSQQLTASGGTMPYSFTISAGALPAGLTLTASGLISGAATSFGMFNFTVRATDFNTCFGEQAYVLTITANTGLMFYPLPAPVRLLETRPGYGGCTTPGAPITAGSTFTLPSRTMCAGIPGNAAAVTGNITVVPAGPGYLTLYPSGASQPIVANSNFKDGEITNNVFTVALGAADGAFNIFTTATTEVIIDLTGYYAPPMTGGLYFHPLPSPVRLLETRPGFTGCFAPGTKLIGTGNPNADPSLDLVLPGRSPIPAPCNSIPATAQVLAGNATSVLPTGLGYLTIYPSGGTRPTVASSNYAGGDVINGPFAVKLGADGAFKVYTYATTDLVIDILGYYSAEANDANGLGLLFTPLPAPARLLETRPDFPGLPLPGCFRPNAPLNGAQVYTQPGRNVCTVPEVARALVGNATVINPVAAGFLTFWPSDAPTQPTVATSNYPFPVLFGYNRHYIVGLGAGDGAFKMYSQFQTDLIVDVSGYFAP